MAIQWSLGLCHIFSGLLHQNLVTPLSDVESLLNVECICAVKIQQHLIICSLLFVCFQNPAAPRHYLYSMC